MIPRNAVGQLLRIKNKNLKQITCKNMDGIGWTLRVKHVYSILLVDEDENNNILCLFAFDNEETNCYYVKWWEFDSK